MCVHMYAHEHMNENVDVKVKGQFVETGLLPIVKLSNQAGPEYQPTAQGS